MRLVRGLARPESGRGLVSCARVHYLLGVLHLQRLLRQFLAKKEAQKRIPESLYDKQLLLLETSERPERYLRTIAYLQTHGRGRPLPPACVEQVIKGLARSDVRLSKQTERQIMALLTANLRLNLEAQIRFDLQESSDFGVLKLVEILVGYRSGEKSRAVWELVGALAGVSGGSVFSAEQRRLLRAEYAGAKGTMDQGTRGAARAAVLALGGD